MGNCFDVGNSGFVKCLYLENIRGNHIFMKNNLNCVLISVCFLIISNCLLLMNIYASESTDLDRDTGTLASTEPEQIHAGTAWDAYNSGDFAEAERQFLLLIKLVNDQELSANSTDMQNRGSTNDKEPIISVKSEEIMNLELGLAYTRVKLANLSSSNSLPFPPDLSSSSRASVSGDQSSPAASNELSSSAKKLLLSSKTLFADLITQKYKMTDCVPAILGILSQLKDYRTMDQYLPMLETLFSGQELDRWSYLFVDSAWASYHSKDYQAARKKFEMLLKKNPGEMALVTGLGYSLYQQQKYEAAHDLLENENIENTAEINELKNLVCIKLADPETAEETKGRYASFRGIKSVVSHRHKNGDDGTSRLDETSLSLNFSNSLDPLRNADWEIAVESGVLSNSTNSASASASTKGGAGDKIGKFYKNYNGQQMVSAPDNDSLTVHEASAKWRSRERFPFFDSRLEILLGTSPLGGAVDSTPVFKVTATTGRWSADLHRTGVNDSILSITGLDDPYSNQQWGRVVKNGVSAGRNFSFGKNSWFSLNGGFDTYRGVNVWHNNSLQLNAAAGRTFAIQNGDQVTLGLYATGMHFDHNSNFYTFGHGGYYSPDFMLTAGPLFRYNTSSCKDYRIDFQISIGWMVEKNADAPKYPLHYEIVDDFTKSAIDELQGTYTGDDTEGLVGSMRFEGWKIISKHVAAGGFFSMGVSSEDFEWQLGANIEYCFDLRNAFLHKN